MQHQAKRYYADNTLPFRASVLLSIQMSIFLCTFTYKINIETAEVVENNGLKPAELKKAVDAVKQYKDEVIKAWNEYFDED